MKTASMKTPGPKSVLFGIVAAVVRAENTRILAEYEARVSGTSTPAITHCPLCGERVSRTYDMGEIFLECATFGCYFVTTAPALMALEVN